MASNGHWPMKSTEPHYPKPTNLGFAVPRAEDRMMLEMEAELPLSNAQLYAEMKKEMKGAGGHGISCRRGG